MIAIIPARGGSKRIPDKNIIDFKGKPMIAWTIEAAKKSNIFEKIIVSTDSKKIAKISKEHGAEVPFFRDDYADDYSPISMATLYALKQAEDYYNKKYKTVVQLMANTPLRSAEDINNIYNFFEKYNAESVISCFKYGWMNPWWACELDKNNKPQKVFKEHLNKRSQDLPDLYCPTGAIWIAKAKTLKNHETFYSPNHLFYEMNWKNSVDIDEYEDLEFARAIFNMIN